MIIYNKLGDYLKLHGLKYIDLQKELGLSPTLVAKFQKNRPVNTETIDKICTFLHVQPGDIVEWIENESILEQRKLESKIAELQRQLEDLKKDEEE